MVRWKPPLRFLVSPMIYALRWWRPGDGQLRNTHSRRVDASRKNGGIAQHYHPQEPGRAPGSLCFQLRA
jgi:hypothetical protein